MTLKKDTETTYTLSNVTTEEHDRYVEELDCQGFWLVEEAEEETWEASPGYNGDIIRVVFSK